MKPQLMNGQVRKGLRAVSGSFALLLFFAGQSLCAQDEPHSDSRRLTCTTCHISQDLFGNQIGTTKGNANMCLSCHQSGGLASRKTLTESQQATLWPDATPQPVSSGSSHRWDAGPSGRVEALSGAPPAAVITSGAYTGRYAASYTVTISAPGNTGTAQFNWAGSGPGTGAGTNVLTGTNVALELGLALAFQDLRPAPAFVAGDQWRISVRPGLTFPGNDDMLQHMSDGKVVCSTCHDAHSQEQEPFDPSAPAYVPGDGAGRHFMRAPNATDQMCQECHASHFVTNAVAGSHAVGVLVASNAVLHPPASLPLDKVQGQMRCSTCHQVHNGPGQDGHLLRAANERQLCIQCHALGDTAAPATHINPATGPLWPGGQYGSQLPAESNPAHRGDCGTCHRLHGWPDPASATNYPNLLVEREENLCYMCHDGSPAAKNIRANFTKTYTHPVTLSGRHSTTEDGISSRYGTANRHAECADCHNVHQLTPDPFPALAPYASTALKGVSRISVNNISTNQVTYVYRSPSDPTPVKEYEMCFVCHSSWTTQPSGQSNHAMASNDKNPSFHPIEASAKDTGINPGAFVNGWGPGMLMTCTDCHSSDDTTIRGPHGSTNQWILKLPYARATSPAMASNGLCYNCHSASVYDTSGSALSRWRGVGRAGHTHSGYNCYACHVSHGSSTKPFLLGNNLTTYVKTATGGTCTPSCHGSQTYTVGYAR